MQRFLIYFLFIGLCALAVLAGRHAGQRDEALKVIREVIATTCAQGGFVEDGRIHCETADGPEAVVF
jgi:hypothetical protein